MKILTTKFARSIFYIVFIGGLFLSQALMLSFVWTLIGVDIFGSGEINMLEAGGIIALGYVLFFGIRFGTKCEADKAAEKNLSKSRTNDNMSDSKTVEVIRHLSSREKSVLKNKLKSLCSSRKSEEEYHEGSEVRV